MGIPGNSHETTIFELGFPIGIPQISTPGIPASGIPGPYTGPQVEINRSIVV
jgi:hypothetical protein